MCKGHRKEGPEKFPPYVCSEPVSGRLTWVTQRSTGQSKVSPQDYAQLGRAPLRRVQNRYEHLMLWARRRVQIIADHFILVYLIKRMTFEWYTANGHITFMKVRAKRTEPTSSTGAVADAYKIYL